MADALTFLDGATGTGDRQADAAVAALGREAWALNRLLARIVTDDAPLPGSVAPEIARMVVPPLPPWADLHRIRRAQSFSEKHLLRITVALFCASLPAGYCAIEGARVLRAAGRLTGDLDRRINETACFVLDVLRPNSFDRGGRARIALGKVRLVHAAVRASFVARGWHCLVINQEDQVGTLGLFSVLVLKSLARLGVRVDLRERDDFLHLWRVAGSMMGVEIERVPERYEQYEELLYEIARRHHGRSEDGLELMRVLLEGMEDHMRLPGLRRIPRALVRHLLGEDMSAHLGLVDGPLRAFDRTAIHAITQFAPQVGHQLLDAITMVKLRGERPTFSMPTS